jgi:hypothetical protein
MNCDFWAQDLPVANWYFVIKKWNLTISSFVKIFSNTKTQTGINELIIKKIKKKMIFLVFSTCSFSRSVYTLKHSATKNHHNQVQWNTERVALKHQYNLICPFIFFIYPCENAALVLHRHLPFQIMGNIVYVECLTFCVENFPERMIKLNFNYFHVF